MKDLDITAVFCEILSGLSAILIALALLDIASVWTIPDQVRWISAHSTVGTAAGLFIAAYVIGIVVDAIGLAFDSQIGERFKLLRKLLRYDSGQMPRGFYSSASEQVLKYWCEQWAYFSCYRNLIVLSVLWLPAALIVACKYGSFGWVVVTSCVSLIVLLSLIQSVRSLQGVMVSITAK